MVLDEVVEYCQLETFSARCRHGDVIVMTTARFGRMRVGKCIDSGAFSDSIIKQDGKTIGCYADVLDYADRTCSGKTSCEIFVPNRDLLSTRPCVAQLTMYFEAAYSCVSGEFLRLTLAFYRALNIHSRKLSYTDLYRRLKAVRISENKMTQKICMCALSG